MICTRKRNPARYVHVPRGRAGGRVENATRPDTCISHAGGLAGGCDCAYLAEPLEDRCCIGSVSRIFTQTPSPCKIRYGFAYVSRVHLNLIPARYAELYMYPAHPVRIPQGGV